MFSIPIKNTSDSARGIDKYNEIPRLCSIKRMHTNITGIINRMIVEMDVNCVAIKYSLGFTDVVKTKSASSFGARNPLPLKAFKIGMINIIPKIIGR